MYFKEFVWNIQSNSWEGEAPLLLNFSMLLSLITLTSQKHSFSS